MVVVVVFYTEVLDSHIVSGTWKKRYVKLEGDTRTPRGFGANQTEILPLCSCVWKLLLSGMEGRM